MTTCSTENCENPTNQYICGQCARDLQAWIDKVPEMRAELFITMARLDNTATPNNEGGNGQTTNNTTPINEHALAMRAALEPWEYANAQQLAHDQHSANYQPMLQQLLQQAETIIDLPETEPPTDPGEIRERLEPHTQPMPAKDCAHYLSGLGVLRVTRQDIANWVHHGHLTADEGAGTRTPRYKPTTVLIAYERNIRSRMKQL